jgi:hypothetical protein
MSFSYKSYAMWVVNVISVADQVQQHFPCYRLYSIEPKQCINFAQISKVKVKVIGAGVASQ